MLVLLSWVKFCLIQAVKNVRVYRFPMLLEHQIWHHSGYALFLRFRL